MSISEKIKAINNKVEQNKAQYDLDKQTTMICALSSGNVSKYEFLTGKDVLPQKDLLEKASTMKSFEYLPLGKKLKAQTDIAKKQCQKLHNTFEFDKIIKKEKLTLENYSKLNIINNSKYSFYKYYHDSKIVDRISIKSKYLFLLEFSKDLNKFKKVKTNKNMYNMA